MEGMKATCNTQALQHTLTVELAVVVSQEGSECVQ